MTSYGSVYEHKFRPRTEFVKEVHAYAKKSEKGTPYVDIPYVKSTPENVIGYGYFIDDFAVKKIELNQWPSPNGRAVVGGRGGGVTPPSEFVCQWNATDNHCYCVNTGVPDGNYDVGFRENNDLFIADANKHPDGEQVFTSLDGRPYILVLSKHPDEASLKPTDFVAFHFDATKNFVITSNTYHMAAFPALHDKIKLFTKQGKVHGNVIIAFVIEYDLYVRIPNAFSEPTNTTIPQKMSNVFQNPPAPVPPSKPCLPKNLPCTIQAEKATLENFEPFGKLIADPSTKTNVFIYPWPSKKREVFAGNEQGTTNEMFPFKWEDDRLIFKGDKCDMSEQFTDTGVSADGNKFKVTNLFARPDGEVLMYPETKGEWIIMVGLTNYTTKDPEAGSLRAFIIPQGYGIKLRPIGWHSPPIPLDRQATLELNEKFNKVNACLAVDVVEECGNAITIEL